MNNYTFEQIKEIVLKWSQVELLQQLSDFDIVEITKNEKETLLIDLTFKYCLAQIVISNPFFAPYQYVSYEAMTLDSKKSIDSGTPEMIYFFYDSANMSEKNVLQQLNSGIRYCSEYISDKFV